MEDVRKTLQELASKKHQAFSAKLLPSRDPSLVLGVKMASLRSIAKELIKEGKAIDFLKDLPHAYLEEDQLHALVINEYSKEVEKTALLIEEFSLYVDNWAVSDVFSPKSFKKNLKEAHIYLQKWLKSDNLWLQRIGIQILLRFYMGDNFDSKTMKDIAACSLPDAAKPSDEYYLNMAVAWYLSMALLKHPKDTLWLFEEKRLPRFVHNMSLQKARESRQISADYKAYLQSLKC